ncbi:hypothetical protein EG68_01885 [Paragonimus skrjabini miyazakii]|uniref:Uncharacterized protein n=1 Tax=Paragonimus skrjabini miyazakii TaxID=59628 RepID=A0A8S9Z5C5_9TREM|nr:hypothetical protein EG68_01885 [Paragonimus skrjabini miyazakii]
MDCSVPRFTVDANPTYSFCPSSHCDRIDSLPKVYFQCVLSSVVLNTFESYNSSLELRRLKTHCQRKLPTQSMLSNKLELESAVDFANNYLNS